MYAAIIVDVKTKEVNKTFDYKIPSSLKNKVKKGMRVVVNFNERIRMGYVVDIYEHSKYSTKEILHVLDEVPTLNKVQLELVNFIKSKSFKTYIEAFKTVVPAALHAKYEYTYEVINKDKLNNDLLSLVIDNFIDINNIKEEDFYFLNEGINKGYLKKHTKVKDKLNVSYKKQVYVKYINKKLTPKQDLIIKDLKEPKLINELVSYGHSRDIINRLIKQNILAFNLVEDYSKYNQSFDIKEEVFNLTKDQEDAISNVNLKTTGKYLLFGPPGSGKTEVYLRLIEQVLTNKKQVLLMVPEVSLIPQITSRIINRFGDCIAVYHSRLTAKARYDNYRKIKDNKAKIIIGTRSSVFMPFNNLGLIILDEAHDMSYLQKENTYYDAKEISEFISKQIKIPVIFGTATPTVNMYYDVDLGKIKLLELKESIINKKVNVKLVDMKQELIKGNLSMFSNELKESLKETLNKNEQAIILVNRRGYAPFMLCRVCGYVYKCPTCEVSLTYHKNENILKCHHCGYKEKPNHTCKRCKTNSVKPVGFGIEQVEEQLKKEFNDIKVLRMDSDTTTNSKSHDLILTKFLNKEAQVLLGTQMVSKGHHFTNVSLVAVMLSDQMLNLSSYLANEKTYNLLRQHVGRIRSKNGLAIIQAYNTDHYVLKSILKDDYNYYYTNELETRKLLKLEPFYNVVKITFKGKNQTKTYNDLKRLKDNFIAKNSQIYGFGPSENYIFYYKERYNYNVTFKIPKSFKIDSIMNYFDKKYSKEYYIDIDYYPDEI